MSDVIQDIPEEQAESQEQVDILEISDEEFAKLIPPSDLPIDVEKLPDSEAPSVENSVEEEETLEEKEDTEIEDDTETEKTESGTETLDDEGTDSSESDTGESEEDEEAQETAKKSDSDSNADDVSLVDYKAEYDRLMAPFKANGVDMQIKNVDDAIQLMQMGAGFHKKMAALKPILRQTKLLEKHGLLDDEKLNFLIDLHDKKPEAIQKFLKDSNIDPLDIDVQAETNYKPTHREISDKELALDDALNEIRGTESFQRTLTVVSKEWDDSSQSAIASEPHVITVLNGHIADGTFDKVMQRVDYERSLGRLKGVSDFDAYKQMGNTLADEGVLQRVGATPNQTQQTQVQPQKVKPSKQEIERKKKKRAASPNKGSKATVAEPTFDPLELSDEDFAKLDINKYIKTR